MPAGAGFHFELETAAHVSVPVSPHMQTMGPGLNEVSGVDKSVEEVEEEEDLQEFLGERIAKHKVPRYVWILDEKLPQNANGKFLKRELKERLIPTL